MPKNSAQNQRDLEVTFVRLFGLAPFVLSGIPDVPHTHAGFLKALHLILAEDEDSEIDCDIHPLAHEGFALGAMLEAVKVRVPLTSSPASDLRAVLGEVRRLLGLMRRMRTLPDGSKANLGENDNLGTVYWHAPRTRKQWKEGIPPWGSMPEDKAWDVNDEDYGVIAGKLLRVCAGMHVSGQLRR